MTPTTTQENKAVRVYTSLGDNAMLFNSMSGSERLSTLYNYRLELVSSDHQVDLDDLLGTGITVELELPTSDYVPEGAYRYFHGIVADCAHIGGSDDYAHYEFSIRPWFWLLTRTSDCRIFQEMTVPDIIKQVFNDSGFSDFDDALIGSYEPWRYCVQYRETDYNFLSRLMEQEGIYFYFKHENGKHSLVLSDSYSAHSEFPHYDSVPYFPADSAQLRERDHFQTWQLHKQLQPGKFAVRDFNFETPKANMLAETTIAGAHENSDYEIYDYPGEYPGSGGVPLINTGEVVARHRIEELAAQHENASGSGNAHGMCTGFLFGLTGCGRKDQNREYLIIESQVEFSIDSYRSGSDDTFEFYGSISAINSQQQFRAPRVTPKPMVQGPQTAVVVGPGGEEIWTDEFGRVKLQFHWDRYGKSDETSSCWVRVSQVWAGQGWGSIHIPRIGHEVIVEFLEGDPDRPIITGRVYNGDNGVPYDLPANQTQSGIKSRSSKGGGVDNFNEIRMEDKKGEEELYIHAEKNHTNNTENDRVKWVGHNETVNVDNDRTESVGHNESITIGDNRTESVGNNESISIGKNRDESVGENESIGIGSNQSVSIGKNQDISVSDNRSLDVGKNLSNSVGKNHTIKVSDSEEVSIGKDREHNIGKNDSLIVGKKLVISAGDEITFVTGKAKIQMKKDGTILISGKDITLKGSGGVNVKASKNVVLKGSKVTLN